MVSTILGMLVQGEDHFDEWLVTTLLLETMLTFLIPVIDFSQPSPVLFSDLNFCDRHLKNKNYLFFILKL
jgi:hypothetical protein